MFCFELYLLGLIQDFFARGRKISLIAYSGFVRECGGEIDCTCMMNVSS